MFVCFGQPVFLCWPYSLLLFSTQKLCSHFQPQRVVFLTDVDGIYDRPPDQQGANHIPRIIVDEDGHQATTLATSISGHDVTGGILGKIECACKIVRQCKGRTKVFIGRLDASSKELVTNGSSETSRTTELVYQYCFKAHPVFCPVDWKTPWNWNRLLVLLRRAIMQYDIIIKMIWRHRSDTKRSHP